MEILHDLKMQFVDLLLVMWIFWGQIGHKNYEDFEHPTHRGVPLATIDTPSNDIKLTKRYLFSRKSYNFATR